MENLEVLNEKMKNMALHFTSSKLESVGDTELDQETTLTSRIINKLIERKNHMKIEKEKDFGAKKKSKDSIYNVYFECGKKEHL